MKNDNRALYMVGGSADPLSDEARWYCRDEAQDVLDGAVRKASLKLTTSVRKAILNALSERDETAEVCRDKHGHLC